jgi:hypothetical protein
MISKAKTLTGYALHSLDGEIGRVKEFYFDDRRWTIRYLVADTGNWLNDRQVLISPYALGAVNREERNIAVNLTKDRIEDGPSLNNAKPVSRQFEEDYHAYYGWPIYWGKPTEGICLGIGADSDTAGESTRDKKSGDPHLRSTHAVSGYHVQAADGEIGHVDDFLIGDEKWEIRYLIIDTRNWWPGKKVLISPHWIERVSWEESKIFVNLPLDTIKQAPEYTDDSLLTRDYEYGLHKHYNRLGYWVDEPAAKKY